MAEEAKQKETNNNSKLDVSIKSIFPAKKTGKKTKTFFIQCFTLINAIKFKRRTFIKAVLRYYLVKTTIQKTSLLFRKSLNVELTLKQLI